MSGELQLGIWRNRRNGTLRSRLRKGEVVWREWGALVEVR